jgi:hypothetical protein
MAGQGLCSQPEAAWGGLHQDAPVSSHHAQAPELAQQAPARWGTASGELGGSRSWGKRSPRSPRRGGGRRNHLVELVEGAVASDSPKVETAMATGDGRSGQATAAANQIARGTTREREGATGAGLGQFDRPRPVPVGIAKPGGPDGPAGRLGQQVRWARLALANWFKNKISNLNSKVISFWNSNQIQKFK